MSSAFLSEASSAQVFASSSGSIRGPLVKILPADNFFDRLRDEITNRLSAGNPISDRRRRNVDLPTDRSVRIFNVYAGAIEDDELHQPAQFAEAMPAFQFLEIVLSDKKEKFGVRSARAQ